MRRRTSDTEPPPGPGPMFYTILQIKLFPFLQNIRSMHALPRVTAEQRVVQLSSEVNMKMTSYHNDEYETEYHHCARNIELPEYQLRSP